MLRIRYLVFLLLLLTCGCVGPERIIAERHFTVSRLGTPHRVVSKASETQIVRVQAKVENELVTGMVDASGMVLLDEPTYELYKQAYEASKK